MFADRHDAEVAGAESLRQLLRILHRLPYVCTLAGAFILAPGWVTQHRAFPMPIVLAIVVATGSWLAYIWRRLNPDSMNALIVFNSACTILAMGGFLFAMWEARLWTRIDWLFTKYVDLYIAAFLAIAGGVAAFLIKRGRYLREAYGALRTYLNAGVIADYQLYRFLWPPSASFGRFRGQASAVSAAAAVVAILLSGFDDRGVGFYVCFLVLLPLTALLFGTLLAKIWAHRQYLGGRDLRIVWTQ